MRACGGNREHKHEGGAATQAPLAACGKSTCLRSPKEYTPPHLRVRRHHGASENELNRAKATGHGDASGRARDDGLRRRGGGQKCDRDESGVVVSGTAGGEGESRKLHTATAVTVKGVRGTHVDTGNTESAVTLLPPSAVATAAPLLPAPPISATASVASTRQQLTTVPIKFAVHGVPGLRRVSVPFPLRLCTIQRTLAQSFPRLADLFLDRHRVMQLLVQHQAHTHRRRLAHATTTATLVNGLGVHTEKTSVKPVLRQHMQTVSMSSGVVGDGSCSGKIVCVAVATDAGLAAAFRRAQAAHRVLRFTVPTLPQQHACTLCKYTPSARSAATWKIQLSEHLRGKRHRQRQNALDEARFHVLQRIAKHQQATEQQRQNPFGLRSQRDRAGVPVATQQHQQRWLPRQNEEPEGQNEKKEQFYHDSFHEVEEDEVEEDDGFDQGVGTLGCDADEGDAWYPHRLYSSRLEEEEDNRADLELWEVDCVRC